MRMEEIPQSEDHETRCPTCRSVIRRRPHGKMHAGSYVQDGERVEICREPRAGFADPIVLDAITQYFDGGLYRLWPGETYYTRGGKKLHRDVWEDAFGPIPKGCHIHHRNSDPADNAIANLECLDAAEHRRVERRSPLEAKGGEHFSEFARDRAAEWHRSEAGRLWHKRHAKRSKSWTKWKREPRPCLQCGKEFDCLVRANGHEQKFCHPNCKAAHYRARKAAD